MTPIILYIIVWLLMIAALGCAGIYGVLKTLNDQSHARPILLSGAFALSAAAMTVAAIARGM